MSEHQADQQASNAIVAGVAFYAAALARAHDEIALRGKRIVQLDGDFKSTDELLILTMKERDDARSNAATLKGQFESSEQALRIERTKTRALEEEKREALNKFEVQRVENERLQRALVESHHEREGLRKKVHESGEAMGWLKNDANRFVSELRNMAAMTGRAVGTVDEMLTVIRDAIDEYRANHPTVDKKKGTIPKLGPRNIVTLPDDK